MKLSNVLLLLIIFTFFISSCNKKTIQHFQSSNNRNFKYFTSKGKIKFIDEKNKKQSASLQLKIQKDSVVWGNVSKSVLQVARFSVLNDSIYLLDKLSKKYLERDIASLNEGIDIKFSEPMIENLLLGNLILPIDDNSKFKKNKIIQTIDKYTVVSEFDKETRKITSVDVTQEGSINNVKISYENYQTVDKLLYPKKTTIYGEVLQDKLIKSSVTIEMSKITLPSSKPSFPFKVPSSYEKL